MGLAVAGAQGCHFVCAPGMKLPGMHACIAWCLQWSVGRRQQGRSWEPTSPKLRVWFHCRGVVSTCHLERWRALHLHLSAGRIWQLQAAVSRRRWLYARLGRNCVSCAWSRIRSAVCCLCLLILISSACRALCTGSLHTEAALAHRTRVFAGGTCSRCMHVCVQ